MTKKKKFRVAAKRILKKISQGYYRTELYLEGQQLHASVMGGIVTILAMFAVIGYAVYILHSIFKRDNINVESFVVDFDTMQFNFTFKEFIEQ